MTRDVVLLSVCIVSFITLAGCATNHGPLNTQSKSKIQTIAIDQQMSKPDRMYVFAKGAEWAIPAGIAAGQIAENQSGRDYLGGATSGLVAAAMTVKLNAIAAPIQTLAENNHIDIQNIVYRQWMKQTKHHSQFHTAAKPSDAVLKTEIVNYGISIPHGFSSEYTPVLAIKAKLIQHGQIIWQDKKMVGPLTNGMPRYQIADIQKDPKKLQAMWDQAAANAVGQMLVDMKA